MSVSRPVAWSALLLVVAGLAPARAADGGASRPPNLVLILADDLGWGEVGAYGQRVIRTPALDRLAAEGLRFTQAYAGSAVCAPSRCVLLTGLHTGHAVIRDNDEMGARGDVWRDPELEGQRPLPADTRTLAHRLQDLGYATAAIGKWGLGWTGSSGDPNRQGFDHFFGYICQRVAHGHYPTHLWRNSDRVPLDNPPVFPHQRLSADADPDDPASYAPYVGREYAHDLLTEEALAFVRDHAGGPFFLYLPYTIPHVALQVPDDSLAAYEHLEDRPYVGDAGYLPHPRPRAAYAAMISRMDRDIGRLLDLLEELDLADDTLVLFTSDNGPTHVSGVDTAFFDSTGGLRGHKGQLYEGGLRVPWIVRWSGVVAPGATTDAPVAFWDVLPTLVEVAGGAPDEGLDGLSLAPLLRGAVDAVPPRVLYWEHARRWQALREGDWKVVRPRPSAPLELYDLAADPGETRDLAGAHPERVARLESLLDASRTPSEHFPLVDG